MHQEKKKKGYIKKDSQLNKGSIVLNFYKTSSFTVKSKRLDHWDFWDSKNNDEDKIK